MKNKVAKRYLSAVLKNCPLSLRKNIKSELSDTLIEYCSEHSNCTNEMLCLRFGLPRQYADEYLLSLDGKARRSAISSSKIIKRCIIIITTVLLLAITGIAVTTIYISSRDAAVYYETIVEEDSLNSGINTPEVSQ